MSRKTVRTSLQESSACTALRKSVTFRFEATTWHRGEKKKIVARGSNTGPPWDNWVIETLSDLWCLSFCLDSIPNQLGTTEVSTRHALFKARGTSLGHSLPSTHTHWPPNFTGEEQIVAQPGLESWASCLPWGHFANWATESLGWPLSRIFKNVYFRCLCTSLLASLFKEVNSKMKEFASLNSFL